MNLNAVAIRVLHPWSWRGFPPRAGFSEKWCL